MKIEIELEEIEKLKKYASLQKIEIEKLSKQLEEADIDKMEKKAIDLAHFLFAKYMQATFIHLGFTINNFSTVSFGDVNHYLGKTWYNDEKLAVRLRANITNETRNAFLEMGIDDTKMPEQKEDNLLILV